MKFGSVCSGIEAASAAWEPLGWTPAFVSEIDPAACAVLAHRIGAGRPRYMPQPEAIELPEGYVDADLKRLREKMREAKAAGDTRNPPLEDPDATAFVALSERAERRAAIRALNQIEWGDRVPNLGDLSQIKDTDSHEPIRVLIGGTPCQDFSVAGLRAGLDGERGNLTLTYAQLAYAARPDWLVWENVPGVLSSNEGRDFGAILGTFSGRHGYVFEPPADGWGNSGIVEPADERSYGLAWRMLDAQHFGIPQRRRRLFLVGYIGNWRPSFAVLFERESLSGRAAPSRRKGPRTAELAGPSAQLCRDPEELDEILDSVAGTICADTHPGAYTGQDAYTNRIIPHYAPDVADPIVCKEGETYTHEGSGNFRMRNVVAFDTTQITSAENRSNPQPGDPCHPLAAQAKPPAIAFSSKDHGQDAGEEISPTLRSGNFDGSHANGGVPPAVAIPILEAGARTGTSTTDAKAGMGVGEDGDPMFTLQAGKQHAVAFQTRIARNGRGYEEDLCPALNGADAGATSDMRPCIATEAAGSYEVRRLTPRECERLQGFEDDWTLTPFGDKLMADGPRYRMLGNSMAVPVIHWIGTRIAEVDALLKGD